MKDLENHPTALTMSTQTPRRARRSLDTTLATRGTKLLPNTQPEAPELIPQ